MPEIAASKDSNLYLSIFSNSSVFKKVKPLSMHWRPFKEKCAEKTRKAEHLLMANVSS